MIQIKLAEKTKSAPKAKSTYPAPINNPKVTKGGRRATATITPMSVVDNPIVKAKAPAVPDASAG